MMLLSFREFAWGLLLTAIASSSNADDDPLVVALPYASADWRYCYERTSTCQTAMIPRQSWYEEEEGRLTSLDPVHIDELGYRIFEIKMNNGKTIYYASRSDSPFSDGGPVQLEIAKGKAVPAGSSSSPDSISHTDIDRLSTYSVILGRAVSCGIDVEVASRKVGQWIDSTFSSESGGPQSYLSMFIIGMRTHAEQQKRGQSPDSCKSVLNTFRGFPWP